MINKKNIKKFDSGFFLPIILLCAAVLLFWNIGLRDVSEWDEARNGVNAYEMYFNHDYINLFYNHKLDTWNAKPPLMIWLIALGYKIFGMGEFALRLPSAISSLLYFIFLFKIVQLYESKLTAFFACLVLLTCNAVIGAHIGLSGDFDALLLLFLIMSVYYFLLYIDFDKKNSIYLACLCIGLAFYSKGTAGFLLVPGMILYAFVRKKVKWILKDSRFWIAFGILILILASWGLLTKMYGKTAPDPFYGTSNPIEIMVVHDTFRRLFTTNFSNEYSRDYLFFLGTFDSKFNLWSYIVYLAIFFILYDLFVKKTASYKKIISKKILIVSFCLSLPIILLLTFATFKHGWYFGPIFSFLAIVIALSCIYLSKKHFLVKYALAGLFLFTAIRHFINIHNQPQELHHFFSENNKSLAHAQKIVVMKPPTQDMLLYLNWMNIDVIEYGDHNKHEDDNLFIIKKDSQTIIDHPSREVIDSFNNYYLGMDKKN